MRNLIIERLKALHDQKQEQHKLPCDSNELELKKDISSLVNKEIDSLINDGTITVVGRTINQLRILNV